MNSEAKVAEIEEWHAHHHHLPRAAIPIGRESMRSHIQLGLTAQRIGSIPFFLRKERIWDLELENLV